MNKMIKGWRCGWLYLLSLCCLLSGMMIPVSAAGGDTGAGARMVRVGMVETPMLFETREDGSYTGISYDFLQEIAKYNKWVYEFVPVELDQLEEAVVDGTVDLIYGTYYREQYLDNLAYPRYSCGFLYDMLVTRRDNTEINSAVTATLDGKTIGVYRRAVQKNERLQKYLDMKNINCKLKYYDDFQAYQNCLWEPGVDMMVVSEFSRTEEMKAVARYEAEEHYIVTAGENKEILKELEYGLEMLYTATPDFESLLYEKYALNGDEYYLSFSEAENEYIRQNPILKVAYSSHDFPFAEEPASQNAEGRLGIMWDLLDNLSGKSGFRFEYVRTGSHEEALRLVQKGEADLVVHVSSLRSLDKYDMIATRPYISLSQAVYKKNDAVWMPSGMSTAMVLGQTHVKEYEFRETIPYENLEQAIKAVEQGEVDSVYASIQALSYYTSNSARSDCQLISVESDKMDYGLGIHRDKRAELLSILNKSISSLSSDVMEDILLMNTSRMRSGVDSIRDLVYYYPAAFAWCIFLLMAAVCLTAWYVVRNRLRQQMMKEQIKNAEKQSREKSEFLSRMSHEIRTPMNGIIGLTDLAQLALDREDVEAVRAYLMKMEDTSGYLTAIINDVLDIAKMEQEKLALDPRPSRLSQVEQQVRNVIASQCERKGVIFLSDFRIVHNRVMLDDVRLRQVLLNLLSNAFKFTGSGGRIALKCEEQDGADESSAMYYFEVRDEGIGIEAEDIGRIFDAFEQVSGEAGRDMQGTGLGLPISKSIVELMGGALQVESVPRKGTTFYFTLRLPFVRQEDGTGHMEGAQDRLPRQLLKGVKILVAEDNEINADIVLTLLELHGAAVQWAENGREAVEYFAASGSGEYRIVLMDIRMPVMDGYEAARQIRGLDREDAEEVSIIAMTADAFEEDRRMAREAGMNEFLAKPVKAQTILELLARYIY